MEEKRNIFPQQRLEDVEENALPTTESTTSLLLAHGTVFKMASIWYYLFFRLCLLTCEDLHANTPPKCLTAEEQPAMCFQHVSGQLMKDHDN